MRIRRYRARTVAEAISRVRAELGPEAVLLEVRAVRRGWWSRLGLGPRQVEVVAAVDVEPIQPRPEAQAVPPARTQGPAPKPVEPWPGPRAPEPAAPPPMPALAAGAAAGTPPRPGGRVFVLVGPTGAGKTTTLAKLAARDAVLEGRSTALVTLDTFRVGAVEQLQVYAEIMGVPLHVVNTLQDLRRALEACEGVERIYVDTPGRSPADAIGLGRLRPLLRAAQPDEVHLVVPAHARVEDALAFAPVYLSMGADRLLVTKLDETASPRVLAELPGRLGLPVSYLAFGQEVPDDLEPATAEAIARWLRPTATGEEVTGRARG